MAFVMPVMGALDADKDGELSKEEIANAAKALAALDKNKDGKLDREELRPQFNRPGGPGGAGPGGPGPGGPRPGGPGGPRPGGPGGGAAASFVDRIMGFDKDGDDAISKDELPEPMQRMMERMDADKDGKITKEELQKMIELRMEGGGRRPGGPEARPVRPPRPDGE